MDIVAYILIGITLIVSVITLMTSLKRKDTAQQVDYGKDIELLKAAQAETSNNINRLGDFVSGRFDAVNQQNGESFAALRGELNNSQAVQRKELTESIQALRTSTAASMEEMRQSLTKQFSDESVKLRTEITSAQKQQREELTSTNIKMLEMVQDRLKNIEESNSKALDEIRSNVDEKLSKTVTERVSSSFKTVSTQLENVSKSIGEMQQLSTEVNSLNRVFSNVKSRGTWAEYQLENILEQTIPGMFERNFKPGRNTIVEFAIKIPQQGGEVCYLPVDSKFPVEDYYRIKDAADAGNTAELESARKALEKRVSEQAKEITKYINEPVTTPFAILYLPTEGLYSEVIGMPGLIEKIQNQHHIMIAGPSTITALLSSLQVGFSAIKINEKAEEIGKMLGVIRKAHSSFTKELEKLEKALKSASDSVDTVKNRNKKIYDKLEKFDGIDDDSTEDVN